MITSRFPYPLEKGDKLRAYYQLRELSVHFDVYLISLTEQKITATQLEKVERYCKQVIVYPLKQYRKWFSTALQIFTHHPFQVGYFYDFWIHKKMKRVLEKINPDHIFCQLIRVSEYVKDYHKCTKTIDYMDALSKGMERRSNVTQNRFKKWVFRVEEERLRNYERSIYDYFEQHVIISKQDREAIFHSERDAISIIPNGVDEAFFLSPQTDKPYTLVFTGNMSYAPNIAACKFIGEELFPQLSKRISILLSGASPAAEVIALQNDRIHVSGWVDDIRESYQKGKVFIAPMLIGSGLQNKLLEAMAMGVPSITTSLANNALGAEPNQEILIAETADEFGRQINRLLSDPELYKRIQQQGRDFVRQKYSWKTTTSELKKCFDI